jgi:flagellar biosynthetic protein FlhB
MAEDSELEKTESASERRLEQAREEGNIPRSRELSSVLLLFSMSTLLYNSRDTLGRSLFDTLRAGLAFTHTELEHPHSMIERMQELGLPIAKLWLPPLFSLAGAVAVTHILIGGWFFKPDAIFPKFSRLNPIAGLGRLFSSHSVEELIKAMLKTALLGGVAAWLVMKYHPTILAFALGRDTAVFYEATSWLGEMMMRLTAALLVILFIEIPWVLYSYYKSLRMTKQELRDESRESDGDPHVKGRIRQLQRESARKRMMSQVPTSNVVVVNPTRYAVALTYNASMSAPEVTAKGMGRIAQRIRDLATEHDIMIVTAPPVARALYYYGDLEKTIPPALFNAVAEVLAYVYQIQEAQLYEHNQPSLPDKWSVPDELDPDNPQSPKFKAWKQTNRDD